jgi:NAD(P)-dependent dehydrogenase (short-subunit alcohol dehydrogenase family)
MTDRFRLDGKVALVTGASRGLGRAIALRLHKAGAHVIALARASADLDELGALLGAGGTVWADDVLNETMPSRIKTLTALDILVNNAGSNKPQPMADVSDETLDHLIALNVRSVYRLSRAAIGKMQSGGAIINITSQMGHVGSANRTVYCMTKHAIEGLTKAMAVELAPRGIRVNAVAPTFIETPMTAPMLANPDFRDFVERMIPLGRTGEPDDVADAVLYLASPASGLVTGHSLLVDGGWTAQ